MSDVGVALSKAVLGYVIMVIVAMLAACLIRGIVLALARTQQKKAPTAATPVVISMAPVRDETAEQVAAVAAAVYAVLGAHRLVYLGEAKPTDAWTAGTRARLHGSHTPHK